LRRRGAKGRLEDVEEEVYLPSESDREYRERMAKEERERQREKWEPGCFGSLIALGPAWLAYSTVDPIQAARLGTAALVFWLVGRCYCAIREGVKEWRERRNR
jgi:hypothetical protein